MANEDHIAQFDMIIVGGGTAGLVAAQGAAGLGARVMLVEEHRTGGDCLWTGCVPSKRLLAVAHAAHNVRTAGRHGLTASLSAVDLGAVMAQVRAAQEAIAPHDSVEHLRSMGVKVMEARASFVKPGLIELSSGERFRYRSALIATGSRPFALRVPGLSELDPITSDTVWGLDQLPRRLAVIGGGPIGCELGQAFARLGAKVTILESAASLLPREYAKVGDTLARRFRAEGIDVRTSTTVASCRRGANGTNTLLLGSGELDVDRILVAAGRAPRTDGLNLESVGVNLNDRGYVRTDTTLRTSGDHIWAGGDITGRMPYTHVAANHARVIVTNALLRTRRTVAPDEHIPSVTYTDPEVARIGLDAATARARWGRKAHVARFDLAQLDRAIANGDPFGFVELVGDPAERLVGATIVGTSAGESVAELAVWITKGGRLGEISKIVHAYPTFAEGAARAADEHLRAKLLTPRTTRIVRPVLGLLRRIDRAG